MKKVEIATIVLHENYSDKDLENAVLQGHQLIVTVIDNYSGLKREVEYNMMQEYPPGSDIGNAHVLINNVADYQLNKDNTLIKITRSNNDFELKAMTLDNPIDPPQEVLTSRLTVIFKTINQSLTSNQKFDETKFDIDLNTVISQEIKDELLSKGVTITGDWKKFTVRGNCFIEFQQSEDETSFYGNNKEGFEVNV